MRFRTFGDTGLRVSEISFGAMRVTGDAAHVARVRPPTTAEIEDQNESGRRALRAALDGGVNCIHSSDDYGTRWLLGEVLAGHPARQDVHHVIKVTTPDYEEDAFDATLVRRDVEQALTDLHAERISFVQHLQRGPRVSKEDAYASAGDERRIGALPEIAAAFDAVISDLRAEGKVACGITFPHTMGYARAALDTGAFAGVAHFMNLIETEGLDLLDDMVAAGQGYFGIRPLLQGMLTDKRIDRARLSPDDPKSRHGWDTRYRLLDTIRASMPAPESGWTVFALRFALSHPGVTSVITSASSEAQMHEMLAASDGAYPSTEVREEIRRLGREAGPLPKTDLFVENLV